MSTINRLIDRLRTQPVLTTSLPIEITRVKNNLMNERLDIVKRRLAEHTEFVNILLNACLTDGALLTFSYIASIDDPRFVESHQDVVEIYAIMRQLIFVKASGRILYEPAVYNSVKL